METVEISKDKPVTIGGFLMEINESMQELFKEFLNEGKFELTLFPEKTTRNFKSLKTIYEFILKERDFWLPFQNGKASSIRQHFFNAVTNFENAGTNQDPNQQRNLLRSALDAIRTNRWPTVYSVTPMGHFLFERYSISVEQCDVAISYFIDNTVGFATRNTFDGAISSFFMVNNGEVAATASNVENNTLEELRTRYSSGLDNLQHDYLEKSVRFDDDYKRSQNELKDWQNTLQVSTAAFVLEKQARMKELEELYQEKLRLEKPASYWKELATDYAEQGEKWRTWVLITAGVFVLFLSILLYIQPSSYFIVNKALNVNGVKSAVIFLLISSVFVYVISLFVRLSTSAFHLSRDAKERYQLTHVYLSLLNEQGIEESERSIVLQSIFSRADTGLLKGDSSPAFPDNTLSQLIKGIGGR